MKFDKQNVKISSSVLKNKLSYKGMDGLIGKKGDKYEQMRERNQLLAKDSFESQMDDYMIEDS